MPAAYLYLADCVQSSVAWTVSCCFRPREHGGVDAGEMPLAGYPVVDAFAYDVRTFVLKHQWRPGGQTSKLQRRAGGFDIVSVGAGGAVHQHGDEVRPKQRCTVCQGNQTEIWDEGRSVRLLNSRPACDTRYAWQPFLCRGLM